MTARVPRVGVSLKMYFGHAEAVEYFRALADELSEHPALTEHGVEFFVIPTFVQIPAALDAFRGTPIVVGAQDSAAWLRGAYTGEVSPAELAELGVRMVELGHAERRRLFHEDDAVVNAKVVAALSQSLIPVICVGETARMPSADAAAWTRAQAESSLAGAAPGPVVLAYEPVWAIGAAEPAPVEHIAAVAAELRALIDERGERAGSSVLYGGSAGPGLLTALDGAVDGLFLGRFAHDVSNVAEVLTESVRCTQKTPR